MKLIPKEFVPAQDISSFMIRIKTPDGSSLEYTDKMSKKVEDYFLNREEIKRYFVAVGGFGSGAEANSANLFITLHSIPERPIDQEKGRSLTQQELINIYRKDLNKIPGGKVIVQDTSQGGFTASGRAFLSSLLSLVETGRLLLIHQKRL